MCVHSCACEDQRSMIGVFTISKQGLSLNLELPDLMKLTILSACLHHSITGVAGPLSCDFVLFLLSKKLL